MDRTNEEIRNRIDEFDTLCAEDEHTDTCAAWDLLNLIREAMQARIEGEAT